MINQISLWKQQILEETGSSTFCVLPWIHLAISPSGKSKLCCVANKHVTDSPINSIKEVWDGEQMQSIRQQFLSNQIPDSCTRCFSEEENGIVSKRMWEYSKWRELISPKEVSEQQILYLDLRLENTCNLKCVMCSPTDSSKWVKDRKKMIPLVKDDTLRIKLHDEPKYESWHNNEYLWNEIIDQIPNLRVIYFAGGEPLIIKKHKEMINEIINKGCESNIELRYNTNGLYADEEIIDLWARFKSVQVSVSIDDIEDRNHYIRYPTKWDKLVTNLHRLDNTPDNIQVYIATSIQILNVSYLPEFAKWIISQNFKKVQVEGMFHFHHVYTPSFLNIQCLPQADKDDIKKKYQEFKEWVHEQNIDYSRWKRFEDIITFMMLKDNSIELKYFQEYIMHLDSIRGTNFKNIFPEIGHLLDV